MNGFTVCVCSAADTLPHALYHSFTLTSSSIGSRPCVLENAGQVRGGLGECGLHLILLAKERVLTALRQSQRVQNMTTGR